MRQESTKTHRQSKIPDIEIIDLDQVPVDSFGDESGYDRDDTFGKEGTEHFDSEDPLEEGDEHFDSEDPFEKEEERFDSEDPFEKEDERFDSEDPFEEGDERFDSEDPYEEGEERYDDEDPYDEQEDDLEDSGSFLSHGILHIAFVLVLLLCFGLVIYRLSNWGTRVPSFFDPDADFDDRELIEVLDHMINVPADQRQDTDGVRTVVILGNSPFSHQRDADDSVVSLASRMTDATFYNCSVAGSHLAAANETFWAEEDPMDAFNLYWLSTLIALQNTGIYDSAFAAMGDTVPADARYAYDILSTLDFQNVDVLAIMYDASDYLEERPLYNMLNPTDIQTFAGNMDASLELLCSAFPHLRIIVMSPTYAYYVDENGEYISSDIHKSNGYSLSTYAGNLEQIAYLHMVSYLDNIYGTVNEDNADDYLEDNLHLNAAGRQKLAERFVYALEYFD